MTRLSVVRSELLVIVPFSAPLWGLAGDAPQLYKRIADELRPFVTLEQIRAENDGTIGGTSLSFWALNFSVNVKLKLESLEMNAGDLTRVRSEDIEPLLKALVGVAAQAGDPAPAPVTYTISYALHGTLAEGTTADFLNQFSSGKGPDLDAARTFGCVFYYGPSGDVLSAAVTADRSQMVADGLFYRVQVILDASKVSVADVRAKALAFVEKAIAASGLELEA